MRDQSCWLQDPHTAQGQAAQHSQRYQNRCGSPTPHQRAPPTGELLQPLPASAPVGVARRPRASVRPPLGQTRYCRWAGGSGICCETPGSGHETGQEDSSGYRWCVCVCERESLFADRSQILWILMCRWRRSPGQAPPTHHFDHLGIGLLCQVAPADGHVVHQLVERGALVLLHLQVRQSVHEVEDGAALLQLLQEQLRLLRRRHVWVEAAREKQAPRWTLETDLHHPRVSAGTRGRHQTPDKDGGGETAEV